MRICVIAAVVTLVALPLALFWAWPHSHALQNEIKEVHNRHLLLARNLGSTLQRYYRDAKATFDFAADGLLSRAPTLMSRDLLTNLNFKSVCLVDVKTGAKLSGYSGTGDCIDLVAPQSLAMFKAIAAQGETVVSGVHLGVLGKPLICFVRLDGAQMVIGAVDTTYFIDLAKAISFGMKGHAVILDQHGRVLAHPQASWTQNMQDMSGISIVKKILAGESGVTTFFSPAIKQDMIAGFSTVAGPGWGVMVPQPMSELQATAQAIQRSAMLVFSFGLGIAALAAAFLAWLLVWPLDRVVDAARRMANEEPGVRIDIDSKYLPIELQTLTASFNAMARQVDDYNARLERKVEERTAVAEQALSESRVANDRLQAEAAERSRVEADLRQSNTALVAATKAKSEFLATMSHEIRTPMSGILGTLGLLLKTPLSDAQKNYSTLAHRSAQSLLVILNDVLDFSKLEAGQVSIENVRFDLELLLSDIVGIFQPAATAKRLDITFSITAETPRWVTGDPTRLRQVLLNLVGNAVKFTPSGSVILAAAVGVSDTDSHNVRIEIKDTGIGIAPDVLDRLFTSFSQGDASIARRFGGTGLGLSISKQLVGLMGGTVGVESNVGKGSTFWFELPLGRTPSRADDQPVKAQSTAPACKQALRILVAEDNPVNQLVAEHYLLDEGHIVDVVANGKEAVSAVEAQPYDLVLMDVQMPEMDGVTAARAIRAMGGPSSGIPIVAVTANVSANDQNDYRDAGMDDFIPKPFDIEKLTSTIADVLARRRAMGFVERRAQDASNDQHNTAPRGHAA